MINYYSIYNFLFSLTPIIIMEGGGHSEKPPPPIRTKNAPSMEKKVAERPS